MANVVFNGVQKIYPNGFHAVKNFNLEIHDREFMIFVGPSGCAKSTTMRMVAGLEEISGGTITIGNRIVNTLPPRERNIAMVFQDYALYPHMTVAENMSLGLRLQKVPKDEIAKKVARAADILGLTTMLDRLPRQLSGGQRQRVALGRCIVRTPDVFMFDEPLSNLDPKLRTTMRVEIKKLHQSLNATMIYVTHDQIEAMTLGDRIVVMNAGEIQQVDTPMNLYNNPDNRFVAGFIGSPPINFFECELVQDGGDMRLKNASLDVSLAGLDALKSRLAAGFDGAPKVSVGVRAEHMSIVNGSSADGGSFGAIVEVLEPVGAEVFMHLKTTGVDEVPFVVRQEYQQAAKFAPGDKVQITIDRSRMHLFDPVSEKVLR